MGNLWRECRRTWECTTLIPMSCRAIPGADFCRFYRIFPWGRRAVRTSSRWATGSGGSSRWEKSSCRSVCWTSMTRECLRFIAGHSTETWIWRGTGSENWAPGSRSKGTFMRWARAILRGACWRQPFLGRTQGIPRGTGRLVHGFGSFIKISWRG